MCIRDRHIVGVEDDLAEVDVGELHLLEEGDVPFVVALVEHLGADVELDHVILGSLDPEAGHEDDDVVAGVGGGEGGELPTIGLLGVVDLVVVVGEGGGGLDADVDLSYSNATISPLV